MDFTHVGLTAISTIVCAVAAYWRYRDSGIFDALKIRVVAQETRIVTLEREVESCHSEKAQNTEKFRLLNNLFDDKLLRLERERDVLSNDLRISQNQVILLQDQLAILRRGAHGS